MNLISAEVLQLIAWFLTLLEFILALYILLLNPRHVANRHVSGLLFLFAVNTFATGLMLATPNSREIAWVLSVATIPAIQPALLVVTVALLKPEWLRGRWQWIWWPIYGLILLPIVLTVVDVGLGTQLWYGGFDPALAATGVVGLIPMATGILARPILVLNVYTIGIVAAFFPLYVALFDRKAASLARRLAWLLFVVMALMLLFQFGFRLFVGPAIAALATSMVFVAAYAYAAFQQMISERRVQRGRLQGRLTSLILAVAVPLLVGVVLLATSQASQIIEQKADVELEKTNRALSATLSTWLELNIQALTQLVIMPDIVSMDAAKQKPILEAMDAAHPHIYLVSTTDYEGINVARSDDEEPKDYTDRAWVAGARDGELTFQVLVGRTSGEPALVLSLPIQDAEGNIIGVGMLASDLDDLTADVQVSKVGESGFAFVVNELNQVVAHTDPEYAAELQDMSSHPVVRAMRDGTQGALNYTAEDGQRWRAYIDELDNGWGVIVQQPEDELLGPLQTLQRISWGVVALGAVVLAVLTALTVRQAIRPIGSLTATATAIAAGDLSRVAPVESEDEIGALARAFNSMTDQLRELIGSLEQQVANRTRDLEQRSAYLEATASVGQAAASILETDQLVREVVELVRERFSLYYVGLFLADETGEWAVLQAGTGEAGRVMLERGHRIRVGEGMVGWSVASGQSRVALEAGADAVRLATPELPDTRSEAALPLRSRGQILGALTVQHTEPGAFDPETMSVLEAMADQVAVTLDNARLFSESQEALEATRRAYGEVTSRAWSSLLSLQADWGYRYAHRMVSRVTGDRQPEMLQAEQTGHTVQGDDSRGSVLAIPLKVRNEVVGVLGFQKGEAGQEWSTEEIALLEGYAGQLELALESARLYQETQRRAARDRVLAEVSSRMRETLEVETVLQTAVREIGEALDLNDLTIQLQVDGDEAEVEATARSGQEV